MDPVPFFLKVLRGIAVMLLLLGLLILLAWLVVVPAHALEILGFYLLMFGVPVMTALLIGLVVWSGYNLKKRDFNQEVRQYVVVTAILMLLNYPVAWAYISIAANRMTAYHLQLLNRSGGPLSAVILVDPDGKSHLLGDIRAGESTMQKWHVRTKGQEQLVFHIGNQAHQCTALGYVAPDLGQTADLMIDPHGNCVPPAPSQTTPQVSPPPAPVSPHPKHKKLTQPKN